ncbi:MAG: COQ9 family protein [Parvularculaceae bacterium]|nr:COQ9 family protein [Parvularculaceae bacterium]
MTATATPFVTERAQILENALEIAAFDGFNQVMLEKAAKAAGYDSSVAAAAFPGGVIDLLDLWSLQADEAASAALAEPDAKALKIREKVARAVKARIAFLRPHKEAARRAAAYLALPPYAPDGVRFTWNTADAIWRALGDKSTDYNFYSKRAILSGVLTSTFARWFADDSDDEAATDAFLSARIDNVMQFEKLKAKVRDSGFDPAGMFGWLARMRYPTKT